ncbi:PEP-CTERM system histidine kinase PrsK [Sphingomonas sp. AOB5]|uniref:XrtA/PEP-CTERM system histidine kinase PrsK n=1 Tax=Sphingomonas sp. AOB5 TaxID=3034017 RepID=UPI0023F63E50|nr:XrtA/PEP-CTERM system histidine kinase PrsK [Sphingomonas sp. AOB5]MDF7777030.1 PEP-CTERM system histidine kinase PrsK [Sphingomonas sp. AOB5]
MFAALILWTHALAALLFGALALWAWRRKEGAPRRPLALALAATALWALSVAGLGSGETGTSFAELLRNLAWLAFMIVLHRRDGNVRPPVALGTVYGVVVLVSVASVVLHIIGMSDDPMAGEFLAASLLMRMLFAVAALVLIRALHQAIAPETSVGLRWTVRALAAIWFIDFNLVSVAYITAAWPQALLALRGLGMIAVAGAMAAALQRKDEWNVSVSRTVAYQSLSLVAILAFFALLALTTSAIATVGGANARVLQTAFVFGSTAAMLTLVSSTWLRAWLKVKLAKHFFRHRYDYRAEWMRFTDTLGSPAGAAPLDERIVKAIADLVESPGGTLLVPEGQGLGHGAVWNWDSDATGPAEAALAQHLANTGRILELDGLRGADSVEAALLPQWMLDRTDAWVLVPLPHLGTLTGAILLARPPLDRALDWEDFDLLKVAGRQVASYLAEARAQEALADAQRFDEFNRRFAFILHDIKNLVSQLTLTARNAERHADKPEFRADMVETLRDSAEKMTALLARLSQHGPRRAEPLRAVEILPLVERIAAERSAQHPVVASGHPAIAFADPAALDQLLAHLVQNAIDASPASEPVTIAVAGDANHVTIEVIDHGIGMSPGFVRDKLFKPFVSSKSGGFGIGAFEARQLATQMDGRIDVTSREGAGSRFRVTLRTALVPTTERAA